MGRGGRMSLVNECVIYILIKLYSIGQSTLVWEDAYSVNPQSKNLMQNGIRSYF